MNNEKLINQMMQKNYYGKLIKKGYTSEDIYLIVEEIFNPYFKNSDLSKEMVELLLPELINIANLGKSPQYLKYFEEILSFFNEVKELNAPEVYKSFSNWEPQINKEMNHFWPIYNLEKSREDLNLEEFSKVSFDMIEDIIEGLIKTYGYHLLDIINIKKEKKISLDLLENKKMGSVFSEIIDTRLFENLFKIELNTNLGNKSLRLNQLRNISAHKKYQVVDNLVFCELKEKDETNVFSMTKEELNRSLTAVYDTFLSLKQAYTIFYLDNLREIASYNEEEGDVRKEHKVIHIFMGIQSQGFDIIEFIDDSKTAKLLLRDKSRDDEQSRAIHAAQFLCRVWEISNAERNVVEFENKNGDKIAKFEVNCEVCKQIYSEEMEFRELAKHMKITKFK
ncbi:hypothetical protein K5X77_06065 [Vagococcus lutrae]|uniref:hypothetical protein n=1 Tax=Vagococcus lutrae TaxID=81947 RepID=UPI001C956236|nr:hypothetical protein [Vagococcus lutrae]QZN88051.1 hypothetical protein K5X77_06065 [Vagococcus lutrae]